jgi:protein SCO1/2
MKPIARSVARALVVAAALCLGTGIVPAGVRRAAAQQTPAAPPTTPDQVVQTVRIDQKLDAQVPLDLSFRDEKGAAVRLGDYFAPKKPVILAIVYYRCPMLCTLILDGVVNSLREMKFSPGQEFDVVAVSVDPKETPELAADKKKAYLELYNRPATEKGWHFLTGDEANIKALADAVGYRYTYDAKTGQYAHASGIMVLTGKGRVARYFFGIEYPAKYLRLALVEAAQGKIGTPADKFALFCFQYDPMTGRYGLAIMRVTQVAGVATFLVLASFMLVMFRRDHQHRRGGGEVIALPRRDAGGGGSGGGA